MKTQHLLFAVVVVCLVLLCAWLLDTAWFAPAPTLNQPSPARDPAVTPSMLAATVPIPENERQEEVEGTDAAQTEPVIVQDTGDEITAFDIVTGESMLANIRSVAVSDGEYTVVVAMHAGYASTVLFLNGDRQVCEPEEGYERRRMIRRATDAISLPEHDWLLPDLNNIELMESKIRVPMYPLVDLRWQVVSGPDQVPERVQDLRVQVDGLRTGHQQAIQRSFEPEERYSFTGHAVWLPGLEIAEVRVSVDPSVTRWINGEYQLHNQDGNYSLTIHLQSPVVHRVQVLSPACEPVQGAAIGLYFHDPTNGSPPSTYPDYSPAAVTPATTDAEGQVEFTLRPEGRYGSLLTRLDLRLVLYCVSYRYGTTVQEANPDQYEHTIYLETQLATIALRVVAEEDSIDYEAAYEVVGRVDGWLGRAGDGCCLERRVGTFPSDNWIEYTVVIGSTFECQLAVTGAVAFPREVNVEVTERFQEITIHLRRGATIQLQMAMETGSDLLLPRRYWHTWDQDSTMMLSGAMPWEPDNPLGYPPQADGDTATLEAGSPGEYSGIVLGWTVGPEGAVCGESIRVMGAWRCRIEADDIGGVVHVPVTLNRCDELVDVLFTREGSPLPLALVAWNATPLRETMSAAPSIRFAGGIHMDMADRLTVLTDSNGRAEVPRFVLDNVPAENWALWHPRAGFLQGVRRHGPQIDFTRPAGYASLQVVVDFPAEELGQSPLSFEWRLFPSRDPWHFLPISTDENGHARVDSVAPGTYTVQLFRSISNDMMAQIERLNPWNRGSYGSEDRWALTRVRGEVTLGAGESRVLRLDWVE